MRKRLIEGCDYFVHFVRFANKANPAMAYLNDDGTYDVYLNTLYDDIFLAKSFRHELIHIAEDHIFIEGIPIETIEDRADNSPAIIIPIFGQNIDTNFLVLCPQKNMLAL